MGLGPLDVWRHVRIMQKEDVWVCLCKPRATWREVDLYLRWKWRCDSLPLKSVGGALCVALLVCCQLFCLSIRGSTILVGRGSVVSLSRARELLVACVVCPTAVCLAVVVVTIGVVGRIGLLSPLVTEALSTESEFQAVLCRGEPRRVVREIVVVSVNFAWLQEKS